jgi:YegS/Rv2252/BmrU family lipid kinase
MEEIFCMKRVALIFNPQAGQGDSAQKLSLIQRTLEPHCILKTYQTTETAKLTELTEYALSEQVDSVIAAGGDGTVSGVAEAIAGKSIPLGIVPAGTVNSFATVLGIPADLETACHIILSGITRRVDIATCNGSILTLCISIGYEADTIAIADHALKKTWGVFAYLISGIRQLAQFKQFTVSIIRLEETIELVAGAVTIANAAPAKNFLAQGPAGVMIDDGLLDVTVITPTNWLTAIGAALQLFRSGLEQTQLDRQDVLCFRTQQVVIHTNPPQRVALDGDVWGMTPVRVSCIPNGLIICASLEMQFLLKRELGLHLS